MESFYTKVEFRKLGILDAKKQPILNAKIAYNGRQKETLTWEVRLEGKENKQMLRKRAAFFRGRVLIRYPLIRVVFLTPKKPKQGAAKAVFSRGNIRVTLPPIHHELPYTSWLPDNARPIAFFDPNGWMLQVSSQIRLGVSNKPNVWAPKIRPDVGKIRLLIPTKIIEKKQDFLLPIHPFP